MQIIKIIARCRAGHFRKNCSDVWIHGSFGNCDTLDDIGTLGHSSCKWGFAFALCVLSVRGQPRVSLEMDFVWFGLDSACWNLGEITGAYDRCLSLRLGW